LSNVQGGIVPKPGTNLVGFSARASCVGLTDVAEPYKTAPYARHREHFD
jgi:hypothetical protein